MVLSEFLTSILPLKEDLQRGKTNLNRSKAFLRKMGLTKADNVKIWPNTTLFDNPWAFGHFLTNSQKNYFQSKNR